MGRFWPIAIAILSGLTSVIALAAEPLQRSVLIFDQSEPNSPWGIEFRAALGSTLRADPAAPVVIYSEILDLTRFHTKEYEELLRTSLRTKYRDKPIGVIIVHGSLALDILMRLRAELWSTAPVVFGAVDQPTVDRLNLPPDVTGTTLQLRLGNSINAARALVPNLKHVALVGDPFERQAFRRHYAQELTQFTKEFEIIDLSGLPMAKLRARVSALPNDSAIVYTSIYVDDEGMTYIPRDALVHVAQAANRPIVGESEPLIGYGVTGGFVAVPQPIAEATARLALRILSGEKASDIPISTGNSNKPIFDWRQLQRFGISENRLPLGSEIRYRPQSLWEQYHWELNSIFAVLLLQGTMITWLLLERYRRHRAEMESHGRLQEVIHLNRTAAAGVLSASFSHELNQPLAAILSNTEAAEILLHASPPDIGQIAEILADIRRDDQRAAEIINSLGGLLKKKNPVELQPFDLNDAIRHAVSYLDPEASGRGVVLDVSQAQATLLVRADEVHVQQVILNLALNAMDAMLSCAPGLRKVRLETALAGDAEVEVSVSDTGPGIPKDKLKSVFETFYTTKPHGTGLGLSIARTIIENNGGRIWAENKFPCGAVFRFTLPLLKVP